MLLVIFLSKILERPFEIVERKDDGGVDRTIKKVLKNRKIKIASQLQQERF